MPSTALEPVFSLEKFLPGLTQEYMESVMPSFEMFWNVFLDKPSSFDWKLSGVQNVSLWTRSTSLVFKFSHNDDSKSNV